MPTDTELLNWLEAQNAKALYTGKCLFRWSTTGRGWRLQETTGGFGVSQNDAFPTVREAVAHAMQQEMAEEAAERSIDEEWYPVSVECP